MSKVSLNRSQFLNDVQGKKFADVVSDPEQPFEEVLAFFSTEERQRRLEDAEIHHDRPPLAGVVRELEALPAVDRFLGGDHARRTQRLRQAIGVVVRIIMERRGWKKTGRKGSLGVRALNSSRSPHHNSGGLAFWFVRAERYECQGGMPYRSTKQRCKDLELALPPRGGSKSRRNGRSLSLEDESDFAG